MNAQPMPGTCAGCGKRVYLYSPNGWYDDQHRPHACKGNP